MSRRNLLFPIIVALSILFAQHGASPAVGANAARGKLSVIRESGDAFRNYDFLSRRMARDNVDWPVNFLYFNNASINKVKAALRPMLPHTGGPMWARVDDGQGPGWDSDEGLKDHNCSNPVQGSNAYHTRFYANAFTDRQYNRRWGYYIIATSHIDHNECFRDTWFGRSEWAEARIAQLAARAFGTGSVQRNHRHYGNSEILRREGNHIWQNDGRVTYVKVR